MRSGVHLLVLAAQLYHAAAQVAVTDSEVTGDVVDMRWLGEGARVVLAQTKLGIVFRSSDEGRTWRRLGPDKENKVVAIATSDADKSRMILVGEGDGTGKSTQWVSTDGGDKFFKARADITIRGVKFHPSPDAASWALAFKHEGCSPGEACLGSLMLTTNSGGTWREIAEDIVYPHYDWAQRVGKAAERSAVMAVQATRNAATKSGWNPDRRFIRTDNLFATSSTTLEKANKFVMVGKFLFVACAESFSHVSLWVSSDQGTSFKRIRIAADLKQRGYDLLKGSDFTTLVSMRLGSSGVDYGNLYSSDATGSSWSLSLPSNQHMHNGAASLARVKGVDGVYLTNQVLNPREVDQGKFPKLRTIVSFDDGGKWLPMVPPDVDSEGKPFPCSKDLGGTGCALHLYFRGNKKGYPPVYSNQNAVGLLLATGWVGEFGAVEDGTRPVSTFLSRDAGWTWMEIRKGVHTYDMGDHGALLVLARHKEPTKKLIYSWNEGSTWEELELRKEMTVQNIVTHPNATSEVFLVLGGDEIAVADFKDLHQRPCHGAETPGDKNSDYEHWNPRLPMRYFDGSDSNPRSDCLMGQKVMYTRRKRLSQCFNGQEHEKKVVENTCACTQADYECDVLYERAMSSDPKVYTHGYSCEWAGSRAKEAGKLSADEEKFGAALSQLQKGSLTLDQVCATFPGRHTLQVPSGYRKITGNKCNGGVNLGEQVFHCTADESSEADDDTSTGATDDEEPDDPIVPDLEPKEEFPPDGQSPVQIRQEADLWMTRIDRPPKQLIHLPESESGKQTLLALSQSLGTLYRSTDGGHRWEDCSIEMEGVLKGVDSVFSIVASPADPELLFFVGSDVVNWRSTDGGQTFEVVRTSFAMRSGGIKWHPQKRTHAMAYRHPSDCSLVGSTRCYGELMLSTDAGQTWRPIANKIKQPNFEWAVSAWPKMDQDAIFAVMHSEREGTKSWDTGLSMYLSTDFFETKKSLSHGNNFVVVDHRIFVAAAKSMSEVELWVSSGNKFHKTNIPLDLPHRGYGLLNTQDDAVLLSVRSGDSRVKYGTVLQAYNDENTWRTTLEHVAHQNGHPTEIAKVHGLSGIYMANVVTNPSAVDQGSEPLVRTKITYDRGSFWHKLAPPPHDHRGRLFSCTSMDTCSLNVFFEGNSRGFPSLFTSDNATGLVMANGRVGESLSEANILASELSTFLSRDGGFTWKEMRKGAHVLAIGDHGGLIIMAPFQQATSHLYYTYSEGKSWHALRIANPGSSHKVFVTAIKQHDAGLGQKFLILGKLIGSTGQGVLLTVDFSSLHKRDCMGEDTPGEAGSDFERWAPKQGCVLGSRTYYARRKPRALCFNTVPSERVVEKENCACTDEDFECAPGFERDGDRCTIDPDGGLPEKVKELHAVFQKRQLIRSLCMKYNQPTHQLISGWQRIRGDTCVRGRNREDVVVHCPDEESEAKDHRIKTVKLSGPHQKGVVTHVSRIEDDVKELVWVVAKGSVLAWGLGAQSGTLVRSQDQGHSWTRETSKLTGSIEITVDSERQNGVAKAVPAPLVPGTAFMVGYGTTHWLTTDAGASYKVSSLRDKIEAHLIWHPTQPTTLLAYQHDQDCLKKAKSRVCFGKVLLSTDSGLSWKPVLERVKYPNFGWDTSSKHHAVAVQHVSHHSISRAGVGSWDPNFQLVRRNLEGQSLGGMEVVLQGGNNFAVLGTHCFVAKAESATRVSLWIADGEQPLKKALFPAELSHRSYAVLDSAKSGAIFLSVREGADSDIKYSSLYVSDATGHSWSVSMKHTHHEPGYGVDLAKIHGFEGIYLANQVSNPSGTRQGDPTQLQTVMTFDNGGEWFPIMPPERGADGKPFDCVANLKDHHGANPCRLHLLFPHNKQRLFGVYSPKNSNGLVLANGFVGPPDAPNDISPSEVSLFMSRDAGRTWVEIRKGPYVYEIADHGALIAAAKADRITSEIVYSWDQGLKWRSLKIPPSEVINIVTQPDSISQEFVALCRKTVSGSGSGESDIMHSALISFDLTSLHQRKCEGISVAGTPGSDFETWSPHGLATQCMMGQRMQYFRRKRSKHCFYGNDAQHAVAGQGKTESCACTLDDYVCDSGFERQKDRCVYTGIPDLDKAENELQAKVAGLWWDKANLNDVCRLSKGADFLTVRSGFRLEPGNKCQGGKKFDDAKVACEENMNLIEEIEYEWPILNWIGLLGLVVGVGLVGYKYYGTSSTKGYAKVASQESMGLHDYGEEDSDQIEQHFGFDDFEDDLIEGSKERF